MNSKEYQREYRKKNIERAREYQRTYYTKHKKIVNERNRKRYSENKSYYKKKHKLAHIRLKYNLTEIEYNDLLKKANHSCEICNNKDDLCIDHCHETGAVRGILCRRCNLALSYIERYDYKKFKQYLDKLVK